MNAHRNQRRAGGGLIVAGSVAQLIAAVLPDSRVFTSADPRIQLQAIAARPRGWRAEAWGFPIAFTIISMGFATVAATMPDRRSRTLAVSASAMSFASILLWLPIAAKRLEIGRSIDALVSVEEPPAIDIGGRSFWPYTFATLGSILAMGCALIVGRIHRRTGILAAFANTSALAPMRLMRDWPPFLSYSLWRIVMVRLTCDQRTKTYVARRTAEGMAKRDIVRCLKRYVAREVFHALLATAPALTRISARQCIGASFADARLWQQRLTRQRHAR